MWGTIKAGLEAIGRFLQLWIMKAGSKIERDKERKKAKEAAVEKAEKAESIGDYDAWLDALNEFNGS